MAKVTKVNKHKHHESTPKVSEALGDTFRKLHGDNVSWMGIGSMDPILQRTEDADEKAQ